MAYVDFKRGYVRFKLVYYGLEKSGKTANLEYLSKLDDEPEGIIQLGGESADVGNFEHLPLNLGQIRSIDTMLRIYTVPGGEQFNMTRQMVLKDADGIVFVVESDPTKLDDNIACFQNLEENLSKRNICLFDLPVVIQYNKRDLKDALPIPELESKLNPYSWPRIESTATSGDGIMDTLNLITQLIYEQTATKYSLVPSAAPSIVLEEEPELIEDEDSALLEIVEPEPEDESEPIEESEPEPLDEEESKPGKETESIEPKPILHEPREPSILVEAPTKLEKAQSESDIEMLDLEEEEMEEQSEKSKPMPPPTNKLSRKVAAHIMKSVPAPTMLPKGPPPTPKKKTSPAKTAEADLKSLFGELESKLLKRMDLLEVCMQHLDKKHDKVAEEIKKIRDSLIDLNTKTE